MSLIKKVDNEFITIYSNDINSEHWISLIDKVSSTCYPFENVGRRPHETMEFPIYFCNTDSVEAIELRNLFFNILSLSMNDYIKKINLTNLEPYQTFLPISKLYPGKPMVAHRDSNEENSNGFVCMLYLNDNYDGGELSFPIREYKYKPATGDIAFYQMKELHAVELTTSGVRYSIGCAFDSTIG
jgi:hypothetical protein